MGELFLICKSLGRRLNVDSHYLNWSRLSPWQNMLNYDESYSRIASCALNLISTFLLSLFCLVFSQISIRYQIYFHMILAKSNIWFSFTLRVLIKNLWTGPIISIDVYDKIEIIFIRSISYDFFMSYRRMVLTNLFYLFSYR
jgi:hypothetical protein